MCQGARLSGDFFCKSLWGAIFPSGLGKMFLAIDIVDVVGVVYVIDIIDVIDIIGNRL